MSISSFHAAIPRDRLLGPSFFASRLTGTVYHAFLRNILPEPLQDVDLQTGIHLWLMHDGAPPHLWLMHDGAPPHLWLMHDGAPPHLWLMNDGAPPHLWLMHDGVPPQEQVIGTYVCSQKHNYTFRRSV